MGTLPAAVYVSEDGGPLVPRVDGFPKRSRTTPAGPFRRRRTRRISAASCWTPGCPTRSSWGSRKGAWCGAATGARPGRTSAVRRAARPYPEYNDPSGKLPYQMGAHEDGRVYRDVHWVMRDPASLDTLLPPQRASALTAPTTAACPGGSSSTTWGAPTPSPSTSIPPFPERIFLGAAENGPTSWKGLPHGPAGVRTTPFASAATPPRSLAAPSPAILRKRRPWRDVAQARRRAAPGACPHDELRDGASRRSRHRADRVTPTGPCTPATTPATRGRGWTCPNRDFTECGCFSGS